MRRGELIGGLGVLLPALTLAAFPAWGLAGGEEQRFSLRFRGSYSYLQAGDVNTGLGGWFEFIRLMGEDEGMTATGGYSPLHSGYEFGADLFFSLTPTVAVGLGAGYLKSVRSSDMSLTGAEVAMTVHGKGKLSAVPIRLSALSILPIGERVNLTAGAAVAYYAAVKLDGAMRLDELVSGDWVEQSIRARMNRLSNIGFQAWLGLEYEISRRLLVFVETQGRLAKLKNFNEAVGRTAGSGVTPFEDVGKLYLRTSSLPPVTLFIVSETVPMPEPGVTYREPKIDLSGYCLQAGLRFRL